MKFAMTQQQFIDAFISWAALHGVVAKPVNDEEWEATPANTPAGVQMTYSAPNLAKLRLPADVMHLEMGDNLDVVDDKKMERYLGQVLALYGLPQTIKVTWREFLHPTPKVPVAPNAGPIGAEIPRETVEMQATTGGRIDGSRRYFAVNSAVSVDSVPQEWEGRLYISVKPGPFSVWWMLIR